MRIGRQSKPTLTLEDVPAMVTVPTLEAAYLNKQMPNWCVLLQWFGIALAALALMSLWTQAPQTALVVDPAVSGWQWWQQHSGLGLALGLLLVLAANSMAQWRSPAIEQFFTEHYRLQVDGVTVDARSVKVMYVGADTVAIGLTDWQLQELLSQAPATVSGLAYVG